MTIITKSGKPLIYEKESYRLRGMWFDIYNAIGPGHKESVYGNAFEQLLKKNFVPYNREPSFDLNFGDENVGNYRPDFTAWNKIIIEFKSVDFIPKAFKEKVEQYLKVSGFRLAFIVNFGTSPITIIRRANEK